VRAVVAVGVIALAAGGVGAACRSQPATAATIYAKLVDGGCMKADPDAGVAAVAAELAMAQPPAWVTCMADGGTVVGCNAPCSPPTR